MSAWSRAKLEKQEKAEEEAAKAAAAINTKVGGLPKDPNTGSGIFDSGIKSYSSPITPSSAFHIRNRMLSKMGTKVCVCVCVCVCVQMYICMHVCAGIRIEDIGRGHICLSPCLSPNSRLLSLNQS